MQRRECAKQGFSFGQAAPMNETAEVDADLDNASPEAAHQSQHPSQPAGASSNSVPLSASEIHTVMHACASVDQAVLELAGSFVGALSTAHRCSGLREEKYTLCQQLAMLLHTRFGRTSSGAASDGLQAVPPVDPHPGTRSRAELQAVFDWMCRAFQLVQGRVKRVHSAAALPATPVMLDQLAQIVTAHRAALAVTRDNAQAC